MLQVDVHVERSTLSTLGLYPLSEFSRRDGLQRRSSVKRQRRTSYQIYKAIASLQLSFRY
jgi:hypothetical protein